MILPRKLCDFAVFYFIINMLAPLSVADDDNSAFGYQSSEEYYEPINLPKFLDTNETIWTYYTTSNKLKSCKADNIASITPYETLFTRSHLQNNKSVTKLLWGNFTREFNLPWEPYDAMDVGKKGAPLLKHKEELVFQDLNYTCAVIKITWDANVIGIAFSYNQRKVTYDLRVRNTSVDDPDEECMKMYFDYFAGGVKTLCLYDNICQKLHKPKFWSRKM
uniref:Putative group i salivary lipocalin n=1 Tax=Rhipicephalus pulchellus TaxID=72859 RepID=L7LT16_RHIPC